MQRWEYKIIPLNLHHKTGSQAWNVMIQDFTILGREGWELVAVNQQGIQGGGQKGLIGNVGQIAMAKDNVNWVLPMAIFKRPLIGQEPAPAANEGQVIEAQVIEEPVEQPQQPESTADQIPFECECGQKLTLKEKHRGRKFNCPKCKREQHCPT